MTGHNEEEEDEAAALQRRIDQWWMLVTGAFERFRARDWQRARALFRSATAVSALDLLHPLTLEDIDSSDTWQKDIALRRAWCYRLLGVCCIQLKDQEAARIAFETACIEEPGRGENWLHLGLQELRMRRWRDGFRHTRHAIQQKPLSFSGWGFPDSAPLAQ